MSSRPSIYARATRSGLTFIPGILDVMELTMDEDDEDHILLNNLGVTSVDPDAIERKIFSQVRNEAGCRSEPGKSAEEHDIRKGYEIIDPSSSSFVELHRKLRAVEVEINAVASTITEEKNKNLGEIRSRDNGKSSVDSVQDTPVGLSLQQALVKDRLRSLQRTKAQLEKEISHLQKQVSASDNLDVELLDKLVTEKPKHNHNQKNQKNNKKQGSFGQSDKNSKRQLKTVVYDEDAEFDAVLDAGSAGFIETEREELVRKGLLTPFHKIKGFERRFQLPGLSDRTDVSAEDSIGNLASSSIAKVAQSMADIARCRPSIKLLEAKELPALDPPTHPFQRLGKPLKDLSCTEEYVKKKRKLRKMKRERPDKKWKVDFQNGEVPDVSDANAIGCDYDEENQERSDSANDEEISSVLLEGGLKVPNFIYTQLFDYQRVGVQWLWELHCQRAGGIIGDEMGLGKTIQLISFLGALHFSKMYKPSIVICPVTLLQQWRREAQKWYPDFNVEILHDSAHSQPLAKSNSDSEVSLESDAERLPPVKTMKRWDDMIDRIIRSESGLLLTTYEQLRIHGEKLLDIEWGYAVLDEGHRIRNPNAEVTLVCKQLQTVHRIIMTGAPIQNKLSELWSLFDFVFPGKLGVLPVFEAEFAVPITVGGYANATPLQVSTAYRCAVVLRDLIMPYLLRRMKSDVNAHLTKKTEHVLFCSLTQEQRSAYRAFLASSEVEQIFDGSRNSLYGIDVMRKICNHPDLLERDHSLQHPDYGNPERSGKMKVVAEVLKVWQEQGHRVLLFTQTQQMLDIIESFLIRSDYGYRRMDGLTPVKQRMALMDEFNNSSEVFVFILTTKVGGLGTNLTGADRVIIYDPDWNPSTDMQARERAWRIGQKRDVTVYRLITRGTIEEKVYHRQIYKHFLTNKILKNPRQRRFFKAKDMKDLFTLQDDRGDNATETSNIFAQLSGELNLEMSNNNTDMQACSDEDGRISPRTQGPDCTDQSNCSSDEEANILKCLFDVNGIHSAINHDAIMNAHDDDKVKMEEQASQVAQRAAEALRESRMLRSRESFAVPTWTGRSGAAGAPSSVRRRFGSTVNTHLLVPPRHMEGPSSVHQTHGFSAGASTGKALSSSEFLAKLQGRQERAVGDALEQDLDLASSSSSLNVRVPENNSRLPSRVLLQPEVIIRQLCTFIQQMGGQSDSASITQHFKERIRSQDLPLFKSLLKEIATLAKDASGARWVLKPEFASSI
ncbi:CHD3-type chromatin-remodeling factor PICKLE [Apostasia shenzhenica]|uniref:CHD3-type chromatin-remodeling factor PICKLE n=1 Tax=Apostasia shenzhenica TaxID=1088818 RepID=A0A2I0B035_9ASPA|nr:CHD3-type chromatin-remodeling factor PICKLE [Apostasia shenzhenica]